MKPRQLSYTTIPKLPKKPKLSPELQLILACRELNQNNFHQTYNRVAQDYSINWNKFLKLASTHCIYPFIYKTLNLLSIDSFNNSIYTQSNTKVTKIPLKVINSIKQANYIQNLNQLRMLETLIQTIRALDKYNILYIVLKGIPLSQEIYNDFMLKTSKDIDIWVDVASLPTVEKILFEVGYIRTDPTIIHTPTQYKLYLKNKHDFAYLHTKNNVRLELHWKLGHTNFELPVKQNLKLKKIIVANWPITVFADKEYLLLYLILHGSSHAWFRLHWLFDAVELMHHHNLNWNKILELATTLNIKLMLYQTIIISHWLFDMPIPQLLFCKIIHNKAAWKLAKTTIPFITTINQEIYNHKNRHAHWVFKSYIFRLQFGIKNKLCFILNHFKPLTNEVNSAILPPKLYILYYIIRPFSWLKHRYFTTTL